MSSTAISRRLGTQKKKGFPFAIEQVWLDREVSDHPQTIRILNKLGDVPVDIVEGARTVKHRQNLKAAKRQIFLTAYRGRAFKPCQGAGDFHLCCGYHVIDLVSGCPMECSYCILQSYLANNPVTTVYTNLDDILEDITTTLMKNPRRFFRVGTGELSDSLALDPVTDYASVLISFFASKRNAILELKTKTAFVDHLLGLKHKNHTVLSWSLNTDEVISSEERGTASLDERLRSAQKAQAAGFGVGLHFDPIIVSRGVAEDAESYLSVVAKTLEMLKPRQISWVSLGLLRYPTDLPSRAMERFPDTKIFTGELVPIGNKFRYPRFIREAIYRPLIEKLRTKLPSHKIYMCMETQTVWGAIDPSITTSAGIERRLCNTETIAFDYKT